MSGPTKEERASKLFQEGEAVILAGGGSRVYPRKEAVVEEIGKAEGVAWKKGFEAAREAVQIVSKSGSVIKESSAPPFEPPIRVSILMNVDRDSAKGTLMLHDVVDIEGMEFQEAVHLFGEWFQRMQKSLHAVGPRPIPLPERKF